MLKKAVFPGKYIQGPGAITELPALVRLLGQQGLVLASPSVMGKVLPQCAIDLAAEGIHTELFRGECCEEEVTRLVAMVAEWTCWSAWGAARPSTRRRRPQTGRGSP